MKMSLSMFGSPASYIQGSDVVFKSAEYLIQEVVWRIFPMSWNYHFQYIRLESSEFFEVFLRGRFRIVRLNIQKIQVSIYNYEYLLLKHA